MGSRRTTRHPKIFMDVLDLVLHLPRADSCFESAERLVHEHEIRGLKNQRAGGPPRAACWPPDSCAGIRAGPSPGARPFHKCRG